MKAGILFIITSVTLLLSCKEPENKIVDERTPHAAKTILDKNKEVLNKHVDAVNRHDLVNLDKCVSPDCKMPTLPSEMQGLEGQKTFILNMLSAFPDLHIEVQKETEIAEGNIVSHRVIINGTNKGSFMEMAPTGKKVSWTAVHTVKISEGKITEFWIDADRLAMMQQLGAIPVQSTSKVKQPSFITTGVKK